MRHIVVLLIALTFSVSSVGWSIAGAAPSGMPGNGHHSATAFAETEHGDRASLDDAHANTVNGHRAACDASAGSECQPEAQESGATNSCCATACHTAMLVDKYVATFIAFARTMDPIPLEVGVTQAATARLDRPPRFAAL